MPCSARSAAGFPDNRVLSHDLLEGAYARSGLVSDVMLVEDFPSSHAADVSRRARWIRGDWQIMAWLWRRVPGPRPAGREPDLGAVAVEGPRQPAPQRGADRRWWRCSRSAGPAGRGVVRDAGRARDRARAGRGRRRSAGSRAGRRASRSPATSARRGDRLRPGSSRARLPAGVPALRRPPVARCDRAIGAARGRHAPQAARSGGPRATPSAPAGSASPDRWRRCGCGPALAVAAAVAPGARAR